MTTKLETQVLVVTPREIRRFFHQSQQDKRESDKESDSEEEPPLSWKDVDDNLSVLPTGFYPKNDVLLEWIYLIDLDRELNSINDCITFDLWAIPAMDRVHPAFNECDEFDPEKCPQGSSRIGPPSYFRGAENERQLWTTTYRQYSVATVVPIHANEPLRKAPFHRIFARLVFDKLIWPSALDMSHLPELGHDSFAFREVAFAILSLATGNFYFDRLERFSGPRSVNDSEGFLAFVDERGQPRLMPLFGSGCHAEHQEPGSSPPGSLYWFEEVLISLVQNEVFDTESENRSRCWQGGQVRCGDCQPGLPDCAFSIQSAVLAEVRTQSCARTIRRSGVIPICDLDESMGHGRRVSVNSERNRPDRSALDILQRMHPGFTTLETFFEVASTRKLSAFGTGCFPSEIYPEIIRYCDPQTNRACAKVSQLFRTYCHGRFPFSPSLMVVHLEALGRPWGPQKDAASLSTQLGTFDFRDMESGFTLRSVINPEVPRNPWRRKDMTGITTWSPVFGQSDRPSMMMQVTMSVALHRNNEQWDIDSGGHHISVLN